MEILGDTIYEGAESVKVRLLNSANASFERAEGAITIANDDPKPSIRFESAGPLLVPEGQTATIGVLLSAPAEVPLTYGYRACGGNATPGQDYTAVKHGTLTFPAGTTRTEIRVPVWHDTEVEGTESFYINLLGLDVGTTTCGQQLRVDILDQP